MSKNHKIWAIAILAFLVIRGFDAFCDLPHSDEVTSVEPVWNWVFRGDFATFVQKELINEKVPPCFGLAHWFGLGGWSLFWGPSPVAARAFNILAHALLAVAMAAAARRLATRYGGRAGAAGLVTLVCALGSSSVAMSSGYFRYDSAGLPAVGLLMLSMALARGRARTGLMVFSAAYLGISGAQFCVILAVFSLLALCAKWMSIRDVLLAGLAGLVGLGVYMAYWGGIYGGERLLDFVLNTQKTGRYEAGQIFQALARNSELVGMWAILAGAAFCVRAMSWPTMIKVAAACSVPPLLFAYGMGHYSRWYAFVHFIPMCVALAICVSRIERRQWRLAACAALCICCGGGWLARSKKLLEPVAQQNAPIYGRIREVIGPGDKGDVLGSTDAFYACWSFGRVYWAAKPIILAKMTPAQCQRVQWVVMDSGELHKNADARGWMAMNGEWVLALEIDEPRGPLVRMLGSLIPVREPYAKRFSVWRRK
jgi:hypothetical protein